TFMGPVSRIVVFGQAEDDDIRVADDITVSAWLYGGSGHDRPKGGGGNGGLGGGSGGGVLVRPPGRELLIGGTGSERLVGGRGDDILVAGTTDFDVNEAALCAVMDEWTRSDADYATRIGHLTGSMPGGLNGLYRLTAATVHDDGMADRLTGSSGLDL